MKCPTEIAISDRREAELAKNGFMPLVHRKNSDFAAFIGAQSLQKPAEYTDPDATANANLSARLPYLFACCRFAHYLKCIVRDKVGSFKERNDMQTWLNNWISKYVDGSPQISSEAMKAMKPLREAKVEVEDVVGGERGPRVVRLAHLGRQSPDLLADSARDQQLDDAGTGVLRHRTLALRTAEPVGTAVVVRAHPYGEFRGGELDVPACRAICSNGCHHSPPRSSLDPSPGMPFIRHAGEGA